MLTFLCFALLYCLPFRVLVAYYFLSVTVIIYSCLQLSICLLCNTPKIQITLLCIQTVVRSFSLGLNVSIASPGACSGFRCFSVALPWALPRPHRVRVSAPSYRLSRRVVCLGRFAFCRVYYFAFLNLVLSSAFRFAVYFVACILLCLFSGETEL